MGLLWSNTSKLNTSSHLTDYELSDHMVFDRGQIRPAGKMYLKTQSCNKLILCNHFTWLIPYESCRLWRNDYVMIIILRNDNVISRIWVILRNILILLLTISTIATCDLYSKHCKYDNVMITLSFFYHVIITLSLRNMRMSHNLHDYG